ncbi:MAG: hypothetical protein AAFQ87_28525, partial [Bacteroidota bacterium]
MLTTLLLLFATSWNAPISPAEPSVPEDYELIYEQDFSQAQAIHDFEMTDPNAWRISEDKEVTLELFGKSEYRSRVRSPFNIALLRDHL